MIRTIASGRSGPQLLRKAALVALLALAGCASQEKGDIKVLESTLRAHASEMRWGDIQRSLAYVDPEVLKEHPPTSFELSHWQQLRIAGYREQPYELVDSTHATQVVEVELINKHTQAVRSVIDRQQWRYDVETERWWLMTGLPKLAE